MLPPFQGHDRHGFASRKRGFAGRHRGPVTSLTEAAF